MGQEQSLVTRQDQKMVMTQQTQQSIKILQFNQLDLINYISEQIELNPLLETSESGIETTEETTSETEIKNEQDLEPNNNDMVDILKESNLSEQNDTQMDGDYYYDHVNMGGSSSHSSNFSIEDNESRKPTLREFVMEQAYLEIHSEKDILIAHHLTDLLDDNGYITDNFDELSQTIQCSIDDILHVLGILQKFEPVGVFARSLTECLALQLKDKKLLTPAMEILLNNLDLVAQSNIRKIRSLCKVSETHILEMLEEIRSLNPKPGSSFEHTITQNLIPDIFLKKIDGEWVVELNHNALPKLLLNKTYSNKLKHDGELKQQEKEFIQTQIKQANWLLKALDQRANTILKIATEIVKKQQDFFEKGIYHLKPMTLNDIATAVEMHESTISRTTNKVIQTKNGMYELKYFFAQSSTKSDNNNEHSSTSVKYMIKEMIDNETIDNILSDDYLSKALKKKGITIARRTISKYREEMNIPSSMQRRKTKR